MNISTKKNSTLRYLKNSSLTLSIYEYLSLPRMFVLCMILFFAGISITLGAPQKKPKINGELRKWHKITLIFEGPNTSETAKPNPFLDYRLDVTFKHANKTYVVAGYYAADGNAANTSAFSGNKWKVHFAPDETGTWTYKVSFRKGSNVAVANNPSVGSSSGYFDGSTGSFEVSPTNKSGKDHRAKGRLQYVKKHYLRYAETGEYFVKGGADSPENFLAYADFDGTQNKDGIKDKLIKTWAPHIKDWKSGNPTWKNGKGKGIIGSLNYLSSKGMNAFSFLTMNILGDDRNVFPYIKYNQEASPQDDHKRFDCSKLDQWEIIFEHADKLGLYMHFKLQEKENDKMLNGGKLGTERKLYCRELIARFGHHLALNWNLGEENRQSTQEIKDMASYISSIDPYKHHIVLHTSPGAQKKIYTPLLGNFSHLTGTSIQKKYNQVHQETKLWVSSSHQAGKPWVVANDEQNSASTGVPPDTNYPGFSGTDGASQDEIRQHTLWGNLMAGGAGVEYYFGYQLVENDLTLQDYRSRDKMWNYTRYALKFFNNLPFWQMKSADNLLINVNGYCLAQPGKVYAVYLINGGSAKLNLSKDNKNFSAKWYNPRNGKFEGGTSKLTGGKTVTLTPPKDTKKDWVILLEASGSTPKPTNDIITFTLINAQTDQPVAGYDPIAKGAVIKLAEVGNAKLSIRANTPTGGLDRVRFELKGAFKHVHEERYAPYALFGDNPKADYAGKQWKSGQYTLTAIPYTGDKAGSALTISFSVSSDNAAQQAFIVKVYPVPTSGIVSISHNGAAEGTSLMLLDQSGNVLFTRPLSKQSITTLDLSSFGKGQYYLKVLNKEGVQVSRLVVD